MLSTSTPSTILADLTIGDFFIFEHDLSDFNHRHDGHVPICQIMEPVQPINSLSGYSIGVEYILTGNTYLDNRRKPKVIRGRGVAMSSAVVLRVPYGVTIQGQTGQSSWSTK